MRNLLRNALGFCGDVAKIADPLAVLRELDERVHDNGTREELHVLGAWYWPAVNHVDISRWVQNKTVFLLAPEELTSDYLAMAETHGLSPTTLLARRKSAPYTLTEAMREVRPTGDQRWLINLFRKHGIRDALYCPMVRWTVAYWGRQRIELPPDARGLLMMMAGCAIGRIEKLKRYPEMTTKNPPTERELEVLALAATGMTAGQIAARLAISPLTIRRHFQNVQKKLDAKNIAHAIAKAIRQGLIV